MVIHGAARGGDRRSRRLCGHRPAIRRPVLGIFRVHGLALIRRFLLAERDLPALPALSAQFVSRMHRCRCAFAPCEHPGPFATEGSPRTAFRLSWLGARVAHRHNGRRGVPVRLLTMEPPADHREASGKDVGPKTRGSFPAPAHACAAGQSEKTAARHSLTRVNSLQRNGHQRVNGYAFPDRSSTV